MLSSPFSPSTIYFHLVLHSTELAVSASLFHALLLCFLISFHVRHCSLPHHCAIINLVSTMIGNIAPGHDDAFASNLPSFVYNQLLLMQCCFGVKEPQIGLLNEARSVLVDAVHRV